jgi:hypothetical protein
MAGLRKLLHMGEKDVHQRKSRSPLGRLVKRDESAKHLAEASKESTPPECSEIMN